MPSDRAKSLLLLPPPPLASCIAAGIFRDTRNADLSDRDRFNFFPATPLVSATIVIEGEILILGRAGDIAHANATPPIPRTSINPPQDLPIVSWSAGPVAALTIGFYPDAWQKMGFDLSDQMMPDILANALTNFAKHNDPQQGWDEYCCDFTEHWQKARHANQGHNWAGSDRLSDWARHQMARLSQTSAAGRSIRTLERQIKRISGQTRRSIGFYAAVEDLHRQSIASPKDSLADLAADAGFSDQSHMGRAVRRVTGFSPAKLNQLIETEEAFWCYRLLGQRF